MSIARTRIARQVADHTLKSGSSKQYANQVAALLLSEGRVDQLESLLRDVQADWAAQGYVEVLARSAFPLDTTAKKDITNQIKTLYPNAKQILITEISDPSVLAGVQLSLADKQLDLSIETKLNRFKQVTKAGKE